MAEENAPEKVVKRSSPLLVVLSLLNILGLAALTFFVFSKFENLNAMNPAELGMTADAGVDIEREDDHTPGPMVDLGALTVNLTGRGGRGHLLRTTLQLELDTEEARAEAESKIMQIRYHLTRLLAGRRAEEVKGPEQMEVLRKAMIRRADAILSSKTGKVLNIWPQDWLVE